ncbi:reverse transcriptase domain-containing protein [Streptomyces sp. NPDC001455]|uniref:reverse transcriptase domain-containing protein n=1 Tax=Streptomyces sp. NPDC001455 TaxID=3154518 RepID=UPI003325C1B7
MENGSCSTSSGGWSCRWRRRTARDRGTPQGSAISPVLANLYLHYAFDAWLGREFPHLTFERYCDDAVIHCRSEHQARRVRDARSEIGAGRSGIASGQDAHRVLQGCGPSRLVRAHVVHVSRVHVPAKTVQEPVREALCELPARGQQGGDQGDG